ncbi:MAG: hypothetical protein HY928_18525 [Elusimicrobia bacterium]|nr:hypothetical protein [Elusimicrobiota bacterium]
MRSGDGRLRAVDRRLGPRHGRLRPVVAAAALGGLGAGDGRIAAAAAGVVPALAAGAVGDDLRQDLGRRENRQSQDNS